MKEIWRKYLPQETFTKSFWNEVFHHGVQPHSLYRPFLDRLVAVPKAELKKIDERLKVTMREMGVSFANVDDQSWGRRTWDCDLLPQVFTAEEWKPLAAGMIQRLRALECFLRDIYDKKHILKAGILPLSLVLGSPYYQHVVAGLLSSHQPYLHLCGLAICRLLNGTWAVKHHYFSVASGISYMMQNRRALAQVLPHFFQDYPVRALTDIPTSILEVLRNASLEMDPSVVLLSSGCGSLAYSEHSFLARRMGIPLVQGGDLFVLKDKVYLKTIAGPKRVSMIYTRVSDHWLDPLVFRKDSLLGVPGLMHCVRKRSVSLINATGSQLADDRALLSFVPTLIRYYLGETPILESLPTHWLGDLDQREMVLEDLDAYTIRPLYGEHILSLPPGQILAEKTRKQIIREVLRSPTHFVAQPRFCDAVSLCFESGKPAYRFQDHILFALHHKDGQYEVFPGALTRISTKEIAYTASELGGGSKDSWVLADAPEKGEISENFSDSINHHSFSETNILSQHVTSRVAEAFYWIGRYLERAQNLATVIAVIETLEAEELNATERTLYRPIWNRLLPLFEGGGRSKRTISNAFGRYRLTLDLDEPGSVGNMILRAAWNAESVLESLSVESWKVMSRLRTRFQRTRFCSTLPEEECASIALRLCEQVSSLIAEFYGIAETTMLADGGWRFCQLGRMFERAVITANATVSITHSLLRNPRTMSEHAREIQLSAFLRLLSSRDTYRRIYQMRIEPGAVLQMLWQNPWVPRSIMHCLERCLALLKDTQPPSSITQRMLIYLENLRLDILHTKWNSDLLQTFRASKKNQPSFLPHSDLLTRLEKFLANTLEIHHMINDGFLNHQISIETADSITPADVEHAI